MTTPESPSLAEQYRSRPEEHAVSDIVEELRDESGDAHSQTWPEMAPETPQSQTEQSVPIDTVIAPHSDVKDLHRSPQSSITESPNLLKELGIPTVHSSAPTTAEYVAEPHVMNVDESHTPEHTEDILETPMEEYTTEERVMEDATEPLLEDTSMLPAGSDTDTEPHTSATPAIPHATSLDEYSSSRKPDFSIESELLHSEEGLQVRSKDDSTLWDNEETAAGEWPENHLSEHRGSRDRPHAPRQSVTSLDHGISFTSATAAEPDIFPDVDNEQDPFAEIASGGDRNLASVETDPFSAMTEEDPDFKRFKDQLLQIGSSNTPRHPTETDEGDLSWMGSDSPVAKTEEQVLSKTENPVEDSWAKAFGSPDDLDESWGAAFADDEDDEFLKSSALTDPPNGQTVLDPAPTAFQPQSVAAPAPATYQSRYASANIHTQAPKEQPPSKPMEFFAELPTVQVRSRKAPRPVAPANEPSAPPLQSAVANAPRPPRSQAPYAAFQGPGKLDLFPPQPSVPPTVPAISASPPLATSSPPQTSRYSPAPAQSTSRPSLTQSLPPKPSVPIATDAASSLPPPAAQKPAPIPAPVPPQTLSVDSQSRSKSPYAPPPAATGRKSPYAKVPSPSTGKPITPSTSSSDPFGRQASAPSIPAPSRYSPSSAQAALAQPIRAPPTDGPSAPSLTDFAPPPLNRFAPRTSSPLAQFERPGIERSLSQPFKERLPEIVNETLPSRVGSIGGPGSTLLPVPSDIPTFQTSPPRQRQPPQRQAQQVDTSTPFHPKGFDTSSPPQGRHASVVEQPPPERPASVHVKAPPPPAFEPTAQASHHSTSLSTQYDFLPPTDETASDQLERWKGSPIFRWGANGAMLTCYPMQIPRYGGGQAAPRIKCVAGEPRVRQAKVVVNDESGWTAFPGPLRSKNKKKDVLSWLTSMIETYKNEDEGVSPDTSAHDRSRVHERYLLWQCMKVFIENDGTLSGNATVDAAVRQVLIPSAEELQRNEDAVPTPVMTADQLQDRQTVMRELKQLLLRGEREKAIWLAVDNRLWSHAMLISSTLSPALWKQVVQEFVRKDVKSSDHLNQSLAFLYEVFAGDWEDSIDQLVPVSARSGFQMVSTAERARQPRDAMEGLNKWQETLTLILSNRSNEDEKAILALGKLLCSYGRIEAAHICFLFSRSVAHFGGVDDPQTNLALVGFDHISSDAVVSIEAILLTEVYEFGLSLATQGSAYYIPHMQAYKLRHASSLAEVGQAAEALQYCDAIASAFKSTTRASPYYHPALASQLEDLQKRLSSSTKDGTSSWKSKASIGKVSSSMGTWFSNFVAGDENDDKSTGSGAVSEAEVGPFAGYTGGAGTPSLSRTASTTDFLGGDYARAQPIPPVNSRYAPAGFAPRTSLEAENAPAYSSYSSSPDQRQMEFGSLGSRQSFDAHGSRPGTSGSSTFARNPSHLSQIQSYQPTPPPEKMQQSPYESQAPLLQEPVANPYATSSGYARESNDKSDSKINGYTPSSSYEPTYGGYQPSTSSYNPSNTEVNIVQPTESSSSYGYTPPTSSYDPDSTIGYNPNGGGGYMPPSYEPSPADDKALDETPKLPKKKSFMDDDDDDDLAIRSSSLKSKSSTKSANDRATDEAFRKAAEEDAARDKEMKDKRSSSGWFGGISLWGGKKDANAPTVYKAKLGEENSFYFDKETNKWVNKKAPSSSATSAAPTPPPPKAGPPPAAGSSGPPSRSSSGMVAGPPRTSAPQSQGPPMGSSLKPSMGSLGPPSVGSRSGTPASVADSDTSSIGGSVGPPRPASTMSSDTGTIDDLMGLPMKKGGTVKKGKKQQRYIDVMAK